MAADSSNRTKLPSPAPRPSQFLLPGPPPRTTYPRLGEFCGFSPASSENFVGSRPPPRRILWAIEMDLAAACTACAALVGLALAALVVGEGIRLLLAYNRHMVIKRTMQRQGVSGPDYRFVIGNMFDISKFKDQAIAQDLPVGCHDIVPRIISHYWVWSQQYGKRFLFWWGTEPRLTVTEPELIKEIISSKFGFFEKSELQRKMGRFILGKGLVLAQGADWAKQRRVVGPAFHVEKLKGMVVSMVKSTAQMLERWERIVADGAGAAEVEVNEHFSMLTAEIISQTAFGSSYEKGKRVFQKQVQLQKLSVKSSKYLLIPGYRFLPTASNREIWRLTSGIERSLSEIVKARKDSIRLLGERAALTGTTDLLGMMLAVTQGVASQKDPKHPELTAQQLVDECKTFFFAGHETTALLLTWTMMLLSLEPEWQDRARAEVEEVCKGKFPEADMLCKLKVLGMILNESLRLYPPASLLSRQALKDMELGDLFIPAGLSVFVPIPAIHRDPEIWGPDAHLFRPDRFADGIVKACRHPMGFLPFSSGPRNCVGQAFATMEAKLVLAMILQRFSFHLSPKYCHSPISVLTLKPQYGMQLVMQKLNRPPIALDLSRTSQNSQA